jgi:hypothetical protein
MLPAMRVLGIVCLLAATAAADPIAKLAAELPAGWKLARMSGILGIVREAPVKVTGKHLPNEPSHGNIPRAPRIDSPEIKLGLWFRTEPAWDPAKYRTAELANQKVAEQIKLARTKHGIEKIRTSKGRPLPKTSDERMRLSAYEIEVSQLRGTLVATPTCELGSVSLFERNPPPLDLMVQPTTAMRELYAVVELVKRYCR